MLCYTLNSMNNQAQPVRKVGFGPFEYDLASGDLHKHGSRLRLQGKPLQILSLLLNDPGRVISRDELQSHLWQGSTFVDYEQGLNSAMNKLRQTLGDSADQPRYVETLPGRGYRFIAPIHCDSPHAVLELPLPLPLRIEMKPVRKARSRMRLIATLAVAFLVAGGGYWLAGRTAKPVETPKMVKFSVLPPIGFELEGASSRQSFALSPDGTRLAFTAMNSSGSFSVYLRDFNSLEPRLIPGTEGVHTLFWPPDGRSLFLTVKGRILRTPLENDAHVFLADAPSFMVSGAWLSAKRMFISGYRASYFVSPSGGSLVWSKDNYLWPHMLPGGEHMLYESWDAGVRRHRARVVRLRDFATRDLVETDSRVQYTASTVTPDTGYLLYICGGNLLAHPFDPRSLQVTGEAATVATKVYSFAQTGAADFSVSDRGVIAYQRSVSRSQLAWVDREGREVATVGPANISVKSARLSPDGHQLATAIYDVERGEQDLWIFDVQTNAGRRLTAEPGIRDAPVWSPDSATLAFLHSADATLPRIHVRGLGAMDAEEAMPAADFQAPTDWSPDGRFLAFVNTGFPHRANEQQSDICVFDYARGRKLVPLLNTRFHETNPAFSPDGKWLAFTSNESGRAELYLQAFRSGDAPAVIGERHLVSRAGAQAVRWRRDGRELFYLDFNGRVQAVPVRLAPKPTFGPATPLFTITTEARAAIHSVAGFDVSADGKRFVIPVVRSPERPSIVVIHNWEALLPRKL